jgi:hypothetical protein
VKPIFAISLFISYNVQLYVPIKIIMPWLNRRFHSRLTTATHRTVAEYILRVICVLFTSKLALASALLFFSFPYSIQSWDFGCNDTSYYIAALCSHHDDHGLQVVEEERKK